MNTFKIDIKGLTQPETVEVNGAVYEQSIHKHRVCSMRASRALDELGVLYRKLFPNAEPMREDWAPEAVAAAIANALPSKTYLADIQDLLARNKSLADDFTIIVDRAIETRAAYEKKDAEQVRRIQELEADVKRLSALVDAKTAADDLKRQQLNKLRLPQFDCEVRVDQERIKRGEPFPTRDIVVNHGKYAVIKTDSDQGLTDLSAVRVSGHWYLSARESFPLTGSQVGIDKAYQSKFDSLKD